MKLQSQVEQSHEPQYLLTIAASTGIAACNIFGTTLHSFAGVGLAQGSASDLAKKIEQQKGRVYAKWRAIRILIIDESKLFHVYVYTK